MNHINVKWKYNKAKILLLQQKIKINYEIKIDCFSICCLQSLFCKKKTKYEINNL